MALKPATNDDGSAAVWNRQDGRWQPLTEMYSAEATEAAAKQQDAGKERTR